MPAADAEPRRRARRESPTVRRQDLLDVTISCLARLGARGTTGREICRQAGVSHGLLRHYFSNPDSLLLETYSQLCDDFLIRFEDELAPADGDPRSASQGDPPRDAWTVLDGFFVLLFSERWASADVLGAWLAFWHLVRTQPEFRAVSDAYNQRLRVLLTAAAARLPVAERTAALDEGVTMLSAVMDGLWLDFCLAPERTTRAHAAALCSQAARRLLGS